MGWQEESTLELRISPRGKPHTETRRNCKQLLNGSSSLCKACLPGTALKTPRSLFLRNSCHLSINTEQYYAAILSGRCIAPATELQDAGTLLS